MSTIRKMPKEHVKNSFYWSGSLRIFRLFIFFVRSFLIFFVSAEETVVHEFATLCLTHLSKDFTCKAQIFDSNGLPALIQLLSSPDPDVQKNSVEVICNLVQVGLFSVLELIGCLQQSLWFCCSKDYKSRLAFHKLGGIPSLLELLKSDFPVIQRLALRTLHCITTDPDSRHTFREQQGFEKLMDVLSNAVKTSSYSAFQS